MGGIQSARRSQSGKALEKREKRWNRPEVVITLSDRNKDRQLQNTKKEDADNWRQNYQGEKSIIITRGSATNKKTLGNLIKAYRFKIHK